MNPEKAILRQGLRQQDRKPAALEPDFVSIEERSEADLITFAEQYAHYLHFYGAGNVPVGDWSRLFEAGVEDIVAYLENPAQFAVDPDAKDAVQQAQRKKLALLSKPQLALFLSFLRILQHPRTEFDELTRRHLDFYYQKVLQLQKDPGEPDQVHVVFKAVSNVEEVPVHKGARLNAGNDSQGNPQYYALTEEIMVNQASVGSLKTLRVTEKAVSLETMHWQYEDGFEVILKWTLGHYFQGDELPPYPTGEFWDEPVDLDFLLDLYEQIKQNALNESEQAEANYYILYQLHFLQVEDFYFCLDIHIRQEEGENFPTDDEWDHVYQHLEQAHLNKLRHNRMEDLRREHETNGFDSMFKLALGMPEPGDELPPMPSVDETFETLYTDLMQEHPESDPFLLAARYVSQSLGLSATDFKTIMDVKLRSDTGQATEEEWDQVYALLVQAEINKRNPPPVEVGRQDIRNLKVVSIAEGTPGQVLKIDPFRPFGQSDTLVTDTQIDLSPYYNPGLAISSPLLRLETGKRSIKIDVSCKRQNFPLTELTQLQHKNELLFKIYLSGPDQWQILDSLQDSEAVTVEVDMIGQAVVQRYQSSELTTLCTLQGLSGTTIAPNDYLLLDDGFQSYLGLWQVVTARLHAGQWELGIQYCTRLLNEWQRQLIKPGDSGAIEFSSIPDQTDLSQATIDEAKQEIIAPNDGFTYFKADEIGSFIVWNDGGLFKITQILEIYRVAVDFLGRLPDYHAQVPQKYGQLDFKNATSLAKPSKILGVSVPGETENLYFTQDDQDNLLIFTDGLHLKITYFINEADEPEHSGISEEKLRFQRARVEVLEPRKPQPMVFNSYEPATIEQQIAYPGFRFGLNLNEDHLPVLPPGAEITPPGLDASQPCVKICLQHREIFEGDGNVVDLPYEYFKDVWLHNLVLQVKVSNVTDLKLRNDSATIDPKTPFEPFGSSPTPGSALYFTSSELSQKKLDRLDLFLQWSDLPEDLEAHYAAYAQSGLKGIPTHLDEESFNLQLSLLNSGAWLDIELPQPLLKANREGINETQYQSGFDNTAYRTLSHPDETDSNDPFDYHRYFRLELLEPDFQHKNYSLVITQTATSGSDQIVYEPYTPKLRQFIVDYTVSAVIDPYASTYQDNPHRLAHIHPFGCLDVMHTLNPQEVADLPMLPQFDEEGDLFVGLHNAKPEQMLNLFFQTVPGSGKTSIGWPVPRFFYRSHIGWQQFNPADILSDSTQGLVYSGILQLRLPADASNNGPLMPPNQHWIRISADRNADAASDLIDVRTQGALAAFVVQENQSLAPLGQPLPENSITGLVENNPQIQSVTQPYSSFGGRLPEEDAIFYTRISERLRHRSRALSIRDYEKLALERFPDIYHAKCLAYAENPDKTQPGQVTLVVIPDVSKVTPFLPLEPKLPISTLNDIQTYLKSKASLGSQIRVVNPVYQQIMYRVAIRFHAGYGEGYYAKQANQDIQRFLSPWAFDTEADIAFGGVIYQSSLIYFLEKLYYVDYVALVTVFEQQPDVTDNELKYQLIPDGTAQAHRPDTVLSSAPNHIIDIITQEQFREENFTGIGYMVIGLDFILY